MLSLSRLFLHNWHRFDHKVIDIEDSLYLAGHNGSGKSSILDALQLVLVADLTRIKFNSSAQERSERDLDTYVRGKLGEDRWLRPGNTVAYIALEFNSQSTFVTLGVCIEATAGKSADRTFFILPERLDPSIFVPEGQPLTRRELKRALRDRRGAKTYDTTGEYRDDMLNRLGGLNPRFFDLFLRALHFKPIGQINEFVEQWLLEKKDLNLGTLQNVRERLRDLKANADRVERQIAELTAIIEQQGEVLRLHSFRDQYSLLKLLLQEAAARQRLAAIQTRIIEKEKQLKRETDELEQSRAALAGAETALEQARRRLYESDVRRRRDELQRQIGELTRAADAIRTRWQVLHRDLIREADALRSLADSHDLLAEERVAIQAVLAAIAETSPDQPPGSGVPQALETLRPQLDSAHTRATESRVRLGDQITQLRQRGQVLEQEIADLKAQGQIRYRREVERLQELLAPVVGGRPKLLCELIEVTDPRWQNAVEAMLGPRRFNLVVAPQYFDAAARELDRAREREQIYDVGLIDLARVESEARPAQPNSLATYIQAATPAVAAYINTVLGDIIACDSVDQLRRYRRAVTPEVVIYAEYTIRAVPPRNYEAHYIGQLARQSQIKVRERDLNGISEQLVGLAPQFQQADALAKSLNRAGQLERLRERFNAALDDQPQREQITDLQDELSGLDLNSLDELEVEVNRLAGIVKREHEAEGIAIGRIANTRAALDNLANQLDTANREVTEHEMEATAARDTLAEAVPAAEELLATRLQQSDWPDEIRKAESKAKEFDTRANNETTRLTEVATTYNTEFQFLAMAANPHEERYAVERDRLSATELPGYRERIEQAEREADYELREHVLHTLREQIEDAKRRLREINDALDKLPPFGQEKYRFTSDRADDVRDYYELITVDSQVLGRGSLFDSPFYLEHRPAFDRFYDELTRRPRDEREQREQDRLTDYRRYLTYDIEVHNAATGQRSRLSRIMNQTSGGETQTPFYLTIAASFVQLYRIKEKSGRPTIRLVAFDEAFSKMDQERIGSTLDLFQQFNLQIITATPLERCEYLVPKICTSLVLTAVKDSVDIEPYRNYAARLNAAHED